MRHSRRSASNARHVWDRVFPVPRSSQHVGNEMLDEPIFCVMCSLVPMWANCLLPGILIVPLSEFQGVIGLETIDEIDIICFKIIERNNERGCFHIRMDNFEIGIAPIKCMPDRVASKAIMLICKLLDALPEPSRNGTESKTMHAKTWQVNGRIIPGF